MGLNNQGNVIGGNNRPSDVFRGGGDGGGPTRSWGTTGSGQSISTSGSVGSPLTRSETAMVVTPASKSKSLRLNHIHNAESQEPAGDKKKKQRQRATGADKGNRGLRQFSMKVCEKVESKGRTTYNEVADELVAEYADPIAGDQTPDKVQQYEEKNIRRRVYDALNVIMAMDIISKDKKEIQWRGLPRTTQSDVEEIKRECLAIRSRIDKKAAYLKELQDQYVGLQNLVHRNERLHSSGNAPNSGVALPFILVQTQPHATVEVEISEDMQLVHFDFNSTPFELHDDNYVLKAMNLTGQSKDDDMASQSKHDDVTSVSDQSKRDDANSISSMFRSSSRPTVQSGRSIPGILKPRVKHEH
ncbi:transcription factor-like protein DPB [Rutidosis leptorrhynchoides]|uniref:transcription factor-like protein DPB n=1 Tax=Rutidosis leptorrhynchoides TaxID=125765 RepID=UPI003A99C3E3